MINLMRYNRSINVFELVDSFFSSYPDSIVAKNAPLLDIYEKNDFFFIKAQLPGMKKENIKLEVKNGELYLSGNNNFKKIENKKDNCHSYRQEIIRDYSSRVFNLPESADVDKLDAKFEDGILKVQIPKFEKVKPKQIEIN